jgi:hypothetical protein
MRKVLASSTPNLEIAEPGLRSREVGEEIATEIGGDDFFFAEADGLAKSNSQRVSRPRSRCAARAVA